MNGAAPRLKTSAMIASFADPGQKTVSAPFGHALVKAAQENDRIVGLTADLGKYTDMHIFAKAYPERFFQMGMAEQLLFGAAAGLAETGLVPFASTYSVFAARRAYDFLCVDSAEPRPRGRLSVRHLDAKEIRDIYSVRAALGSLAARTLCELPERKTVIASLRAAVDAMAAATKGTLEERIESDLEFHRTLCRLTGNETLLHSWESLEGSIRMSIMFAGREKGVRNMSVDRHHDIVAAIETGDGSLARKTIREHMESAADNLVA
jgi:hypothetical protein